MFKKVKMKKRKIFLIFIMLIVLFIFIGKIPMKKAVDMEEFTDVENKNIFLCKITATTGSSWLVQKIGDKEWESVYLEGKTPIMALNKNTFFFFSKNTFVIEAESVGKKIIKEDGEIETYYFANSGQDIESKKINNGEEYNILKVKSWDIIAPIDRGESIRVCASKKYLNLYDFIF